MHFKLIVHSLGTIVLLLALTMVFPLVWALKENSPDSTALVLSILIAAVVGIILKAVKPAGTFNRRDGFAIVGFGWLLVVILGALPIFLSGTVSTYTDAFFETMSGFTTTGATILDDIETVSCGILFWRSFTHWLGGMGIIMLSLAIFSVLHNGVSLFQAEVPGLTPERLLPRLKQTAIMMWLIYSALSLLQTIALNLSGLSLYESLIHTFGTMATGGFSSRNLSIQSFNSGRIEAIMVVFMVLAGINFSLYYRLFQKRDLKKFFSATEIKGYFTILFLAVVVVAFSLFTGLNLTLPGALRRAVFQVVSICTTTGFSSDNFDAWPSLAKGVLFLLMFVGGCTGSTAGSIKVARIVLLFKYALRQILLVARPRLVMQTKLGKSVIPDKVIHETLSFFFLYVVLFVFGALVVMGTGQDMLTSFAASAATIGNVGPGFGGFGPLENYAGMHVVAKWVLSFLMLVGRLEILTVLVMLSPSFWRK